MTTAIGIDMGKFSFWASCDENDVHEFANTDAGLKTFFEMLAKRSIVPSETTVGVEATGAYHLFFCANLVKHGWRVMVINPLESNRVLASQSLRKVKTDKRDAIAIRKMVVMGLGYPYTDTDETLALKTLIVERAGLVGMRAMLKQRREAHRTKQKAISKTLHDSSKTVFAALKKEITAIERRFAKHDPETQALLRSIPGIGVFSAAALVAFVGDINRFSSPEKLVAYMGLDCRVFESGTSIKGKGYITKRGNSFLRQALWNAAFISRQKVPYLKAYFEKKKGEGKHYLSAMCAVERKLVLLVYAVWKRGTPYEKRELAR
jgi:transposase